MGTLSHWPISRSAITSRINEPHSGSTDELSTGNQEGSSLEESKVPSYRKVHKDRNTPKKEAVDLSTYPPRFSYPLPCYTWSALPDCGYAQAGAPSLVAGANAVVPMKTAQVFGVLAFETHAV